MACAAAGMPVALGARRVEKLDAVVDRIRRSGGRAIAVATDVVDPGQCQALVEASIEKFGSLYAVYANAGYGEERSIADTDDQALRAMFETNVFGSMNVVRPALAHMLDPSRNFGPGESRGHILFCSSCLSKLTIPYCGAYCATKAVQNHLSRAMRMELEPRGVHVSSVHPIGTKTEFFDEMARRSGQAKPIEHTPGWFMQSADFVAKCTVKCLQRPKAEVWTGVRGRLVRAGMTGANLLPQLTDLALRGMVKRRMLPHLSEASAREVKDADRADGQPVTPPAA